MFRSLKYFIKEGVKNVYINGIMSIASVLVMVCCLVMTGVAFLFYKNIQDAIKNIESNNNITVYMKYESKADTEEIKNQIDSIPNVESCVIYPKSEAMKEYEGILGDSITSLFEGEANPLPDAFKVQMVDLSLYNDTVEKIMSISEVDSISDRSEIAKKLSDLKKLVGLIGFWVVLGLVLVSLMIISNTIRITMHNRRFEISIMKSVGATNAFIRAPFIIEGLILGIISAVLSIVILKIVCGQAIGMINTIIPFNFSSFNRMFKELFLGFVCSGAFIGVFASLISIKKYLKKEGGISVAW